MKLKSLKFLTASLLCIGVFALTACNNDSGNSSTKGAEDKAADSAGATTSSTTVIKKKAGKASTVIVTADANVKMKKDEKGYYNYTEVLPGYNGGQSALEGYITDHIEYPQSAIDNNIQGTVHVQFLVDDKGNISNVTTVGNSLGYGLEEEAVRVVSNMPKWTPGQVKGKTVSTWRTLPITYRIEES